jgi:hypothetical protein
MEARMKDPDAVLDERFSGLSDSEIQLLADALASLDAHSLDQAAYCTYIRLQLAIEVQLSERNYDPDSTLEYAGAVQLH